MAYLTLDADVKDDFVQDIPALQAMFEMAKASRALTSGLRRDLLDSGPNQLVAHAREPSWKQKFVLKFSFCLLPPTPLPGASRPLTRPSCTQWPPSW